MRKILLDTETTGLSPKQGHRIIEIGCVELIDRTITEKNFHYYINPERPVDQGAINVHGITNEFLVDKGTFDTIVDDFLAFIEGAELIIHNAPFDVGFLNHELKLQKKGYKDLSYYCDKVTDTLVMARQKHVGQKNSLDALCTRYRIDNSKRDLHGALLDAQILGEVYLAMTGGQIKIDLSCADASQKTTEQTVGIQTATDTQFNVPVQKATAAELEAHAMFMEQLDIAKPT